jgi:glycosyltransferase 2 family protein
VTDRPERRRSSWYFVQVRGPRSRRPVDVALVVLGLLLTAASARAAVHRGRLEGAAVDVSDALPSWATSLFEACYALGAAYVVVVLVVVLFTARRRGRLPLTLVMAIGLSVIGAVLASIVVGDGWPDLMPSPARGQAEDNFPTVRVAAVTAALLVLRPWVVLSFRRLNVLIVAVECVAAWAIGIAGPSDVLGALALGVLAAGVTLVVLGSPGGHPDLAGVSGSLRDLGIEVDDLHFAERQPWGARILYGTSASGDPLQIRVFGRDATDAHRAARWWRALVYRDQASPGSTRLQMVEHEALVTLLAAREGVGVTPVVAAAASQGDALIVLGAPPDPLAGDPAVDDAVLRETWLAVSRLHAAGLCHGELTLEHVGATDTGLVFSGFADGSVGSSPARRAQEVATLLTSQALLVGADRSVDAAVAGLGADAVAAAQPYLQRAALPRTLRAAANVKSTLTSLRDTITDRTGVAPQPPAEIARVQWRDLVQTGLVLLAAYALLTTLAQLDWSTVLDSWADANWAWILLGLVIAQGTSAADSVSTMSMVTTRLPLFPLMMLQYAIKFVGLAISATMGRIGLNTVFLGKFGVGPTVAVTVSALDSFAGAVVNVLIVLVALPFADSVPDLQLDGSDDTWRIVALLGAAVVASIIAVALVPRLRNRVVLLTRNAWSAVRVITDSPSRGLLLLGSNLVSLLITAVSMACMVKGIHPGPSYATLVAVTAGAALFASIIPVPGNVGVGEAAITAGLVAVGIPSGPAFAIAVTQRIATSYLPEVFGAWAVRWLRRADYIS